MLRVYHYTSSYTYDMMITDDGVNNHLGLAYSHTSNLLKKLSSLLSFTIVFSKEDTTNKIRNTNICIQLKQGALHKDYKHLHTDNNKPSKHFSLLYKHLPNLFTTSSSET